MTQRTTMREKYLKTHDFSSWSLQYQALEKKYQHVPFFQATRKKAFQCFQELGFPTTKQEDWKYTNLSRLAEMSFQPAPLSQTRLTGVSFADTALPFALSKSSWHRLVFLNGSFSHELSLPPSEEGITFCSIKDLLSAEHPQTEGSIVFEKYFSHVASFEDKPFVALNTALVDDGAIVRIKKGTLVSLPVLIVFLTTADSAPIVSHPRVLIVAEENSQSRFVEIYAGQGEQVYFTNATTELIIAEDSQLDHCKLELEKSQAFHVGSTHVYQEARSCFSSHVFSFGGQLVRNETMPCLRGEGVVTALLGLTILDGNQHVDNATVIDHAKPHGQSNELYKGIYGDKSRGVFSGTIIVRPHAQKTNAIQSNKSILLSEDAIVDSRPQLKIWADDVRCTHGATVGQLDENALFYLRSRGISEKQSRKMLIEAFVKEVIDTVKSDALRRLVGELVDRKLSGMLIPSAATI